MGNRAAREWAETSDVFLSYMLDDEREGDGFGDDEDAQRDRLEIRVDGRPWDPLDVDEIGNRIDRTKRGTSEAQARGYRRRSARIRDGGVWVTSDQRAMVFAAFKRQCVYCGGMGALTIDHVKPLALGGKDAIDNVVACCTGCNARKGAKPLSKWFAGRSRDYVVEVTARIEAGRRKLMANGLIRTEVASG